MLTPQQLINILRAGSAQGLDPNQLRFLRARLKSENETPETVEKIQKIIDGTEEKQRNLSEEIKNWVLLQTGYINVTDCYNELHIIKKEDKNNARVNFHRLTEEGLIERYGKKSGMYRKIETKKIIQEWWKAAGRPLLLDFPLDVHKFAKIFPGNIILIEGQKSQGKTAFALEFARLNCDKFEGKTLYQNIEMSDDEILQRIESYPADILNPEHFQEKIEIVRQTECWWDFIQSDGLNIVDYVVEYKETYLIAEYIFNIHKKLKNGIALIVVQRDPNKMYGSGGYSIRNIPRLIISLQNHVLKLEDVKSFWIRGDDRHNPTGMSIKYKLRQWWDFSPEGEWYKEEKEASNGLFKSTRNRQ